MNINKNSLRKGFTLVELLVVIAIIGILIGMLLPAVQNVFVKPRGERTCANNMRQMGLALHNYESAHKQFPSAGQAKRGGSGSNSGQNVFFTDRGDLESFADASHSVQTYILPFIEQNNVYNLVNIRYRYDIDPTGSEAPTNQQAAKVSIPSYLCPSTQRSGPYL